LTAIGETLERGKFRPTSDLRIVMPAIRERQGPSDTREECLTLKQGYRFFEFVSGMGGSTPEEEKTCRNRIDEP
jgi:hypothetical protein